MIIKNIIMLGIVFLCTACNQNQIKYNYWDTQSNPDFFPEIHSQSHAVPWLLDKKSLGIAFSGGGTRSAAATLGQLRALKISGILDQARYISAVSGGSWASVPYSFLPEENTKCNNQLITEEAFLAEYIPPEKIDENNLNTTPAKNSLAYAVANSYGLFFKTIGSLSTGSGDESFAKALASVFLKPFCLNENRHISSHNEVLRLQEDLNPKYINKDNVYLARRNNPYLIVGASFLARNTRQKTMVYPVEITPLYSGMRELITGHPLPFIGPDYVIGGNYVENIGYDARYVENEHSDNSGIVTGNINRPRYIFTLADTIAASGAAPSAVAPAITQGIGFPEFRHWTIHQDKRGQYPLDFQHGDGGLVDNIGIIPLLARKIESIIVFVNSENSFKNKNFKPGDDPATEFQLYTNLKAYFKKDPVNYPYAHVFEDNDVNDNGAFNQLRKDFISDSNSGNPLVHCNKYNIKSNAAFGIEVDENYKPNICWFYLESAEKWNDSIINSSQSGKHITDLINQKGQFKHFPHYKTFFENKPAIVDLTYPQVNALSNFTAWSVCQGMEDINNTLSIKSNNYCEN